MENVKMEKQPPESADTQEKEVIFDGLIEGLLKKVYFPEVAFADKEKFRVAWRDALDAETREEYVFTRKAWIEMKAGGDDFRRCLEKKINDILDARSPVYRIFDAVRIYEALEYENSVDFFNSIINHEAVWNVEDGSTAHTILQYLRMNHNAETPQQLIMYIRNICSDDYVRSYLLSSDIKYPIRALMSCVGREKATELTSFVCTEHPELCEHVSRLCEDTLFNERGYMRTESNFSRNTFNKGSEERFLEELQMNPIAYHDRYPTYDNDFDGDYDDMFDAPYGLYPTEKSFEDSHSRTELVLSESEELIRRVNSLTLKADVAPTAAEAIQLHMFNFMRAFPDAQTEEIEREYAKIKKLSDIEKRCSEIENPLPTIGIEIEVPERFLGIQKEHVLNAFHIVNHDESAFEPLWEVAPTYSYSAAVQARMIQELAHMGALPIDRNTKKVPESEPLSLHINFGMSSEVNYIMNDKYKDEIYRVSDMIVAAYTSSNRIAQRKTSASVYADKNAEESTKSESGDIVKGDDYHRPKRVELRALEFKDFPSFRMLYESQLVMAMLVAHVKVEQNMKHAKIDERLSELWSDFNKEIKSYLESEGVELNMVDFKPYMLRKKLNETDMRYWSRFLVSDYARKVKAAIREAGYYA